MANLYPGRWARDLLGRLGYQPTEHNITALLAWQYAEGGHTNGARWNPLNTTQPMPGAGNTGTQGNIKVYRDYEQGMDATVKTLRNGRYGAVLAALKKGTSAKAVTDAVVASAWGTTSLITDCLSRGRETARKHPSLWEQKMGAKPTAPATPGKAKRPASGGSRSGSGRVTLDLEQLEGVVRSLTKGAGDADVAVRRVGTSVHDLDQALLAAGATSPGATGGAAAPATALAGDLLAKVRATTAPLVDPQGALAAVPRHLRWEADLVTKIRWAASVADGGGSKADQRKVDQLLATLAKGGKVTTAERVALEMLLRGQLKVGTGAGAKAKAKGPAKAKRPATKRPGSGTPAKTGGVGRKALAIGRKEVGVHETSDNWSTRIGVYQKTTGAYRQAWCASFVNWALRRAGKTVPGGLSLAGVSTWVGLARQKRSGLRLVSAADARPGDLVAYDWGGGTDFGSDGHIGIVATSPKGGRWTALEGNTSAGKVEIKHRSSSMGNVVFIRVA
ncbi:CHAP domain-containing protein [Aquihabitans sp. G128]|uniref:CHAP domain-containing protein n=1 Tax=Aquihabitans sp. G128 TaxID=2849779 RepID=UPI001C23D9CB|nr:CHAP domain-containing protein [Aquihabitans sp. G128]QXC61374.1 CHAP domain-containing protein [Aquihabitans sp. G128]